jgi:hypothetical protein
MCVFWILDHLIRTVSGASLLANADPDSSFELNADPDLAVKLTNYLHSVFSLQCWLFVSLSLLQQGQLAQSRRIIRYIYRQTQTPPLKELAGRSVRLK